VEKRIGRVSMPGKSEPYPRRYERKPRVLDAIQHPGQEYDAFTGTWVRKGWIAQRQALTDSAIADWDLMQGTCNLCGQEIRLHPTARAWTADPSLCPPKQEKEPVSKPVAYRRWNPKWSVWDFTSDLEGFDGDDRVGWQPLFTERQK